MTTTYVSFGFDHRHDFGGEQVFDRHTLAKITAKDPRAIAHELFGLKWCTDYPGEKGEAEAVRWGYRIVEVTPEQVAAAEDAIADRAAATMDDPL